ncbi:hypothetical protein QFC21_004539 [Naganishia friedmannii]|uniref:Uncharacterized protein n=1 Tax=Naganishia friedmannii TaxID=89922 RepID=A0ACC2VGH3_9TREE|nr:hypothetical protein QFC21_004539 [Naganishia friedmannii]
MVSVYSNQYPSSIEWVRKSDSDSVFTNKVANTSSSVSSQQVSDWSSRSSTSCSWDEHTGEFPQPKQIHRNHNVSNEFGWSKPDVNEKVGPLVKRPKWLRRVFQSESMAIFKRAPTDALDRTGTEPEKPNSTPMPAPGFFNLKNLSTSVLSLRNSSSEKQGSTPKTKDEPVATYSQRLRSPTSPHSKPEKRKSVLGMNMLVNQSLPNLLFSRKGADIGSNSAKRRVEKETGVPLAKPIAYKKDSIVGLEYTSPPPGRVNRLDSPQSHYRLRDRPLSLQQLQDLRSDAAHVFATARRPLTPDRIPVYRRSTTMPSSPLAPTSPLSMNAQQRGRRKPVPYYLQLDGQSGFLTTDETPTPMELTPLGSPFDAPSIAPFYSNSRAAQSMLALPTNQDDFRVSTSPLLDSPARCPSVIERAASTLSTQSCNTSGTFDSLFYSTSSPQRGLSSLSVDNVCRREFRETASSTMKAIAIPKGRYDIPEVRLQADTGITLTSRSMRPTLYSRAAHSTPTLLVEEVE